VVLDGTQRIVLTGVRDAGAAGARLLVARYVAV
jgi:hypothetical protein